MQNLKKILLIVFGLPLMLLAQEHLLSGEYFWDNDPGQGNGFPFSASDGSFNERVEEMITSGTAPSTGLHILNVRTQDKYGYWSSIFKYVVNVMPAFNPEALNVQYAEYFWDTDPGQGNGTALVAVDGDFDDIIEKVVAQNASGQSVGVHAFTVRFQDANGAWSRNFTNIIYVSAPAVIVQTEIINAEYYWDADPGQGNGISLSAADGSFDEVLEHVIGSGLNAPSLGVHTFSVRMQGDNGTWSKPFTQVIEVHPDVVVYDGQITEAEFYWDADPGQGNGTPIKASNGNLDNVVEHILSNGLAAPSIGVHTFSVRIKDNAGNWGRPFTQVFDVNPDVVVYDGQITEAEFYWDADPGQGNGTPITASNGNLDNVVEHILSNGLAAPSLGVHTFSVRIKDNAGNWGRPFTQVFDVNPDAIIYNASVIEAEFYWDTDPGQGNGTSITASNGNLDEVIEHILHNNIAAPGVGVHTFSVRIKDNAGNWGRSFTQVFDVNPDAVVYDRKVVIAEYFWNDDPGYGNGTTLVALDGDFNEAIEAAFKNNLPTPVGGPGVYGLHVRVQDGAGNWSKDYVKPVSIHVDLLLPHVWQIFGQDTFCYYEERTAVQYYVDTFKNDDNTYHWTIEGGTIVDGDGTGYITVDWDENVSQHRLEIEACNRYGCINPVVIDTLITTDSAEAHFTFVEDWEQAHFTNTSVNATDYTWKFGDGFTSNEMDPSHTFDYFWNWNVTLIADNGCNIDSTSAEVMAGEMDTLIFVSFDVDHISCNGSNDGKIKPAAFGGVAPYMFEWSNGMTGDSIDNLSPGIYTVIVRDTFENVAYDTIEVLEPQILSVQLSSAGRPLCYNDSVVSIEANISGGVAPYSVSWSNGASSQNVNYTVGGQHIITIEDANGCIILDTIEIDQPNSLELTLSSTPRSCGDADGTIDLTVSGLDANSSCEYQWSNGATTEDLQGLEEGLYSVIVTSSNGCVLVDSIYVEGSEPLAMTSSITHVNCNGENTGVIDLSVNSYSNVQYSWSNGSTEEDLTYISAGVYTVEVSNGSCSLTETFLIEEPGMNELVLESITNLECASDQNGSIDITVVGDNAPYTFAWSNGTTTEDLNNISGGHYSVMVTDVNGCEMTMSYVVESPELLTLDMNGVNPTSASNDDGMIDITISGGVEPYTIDWDHVQLSYNNSGNNGNVNGNAWGLGNDDDDDDEDDNNGSETEDLDNLGAGTYTVTITDANGCHVTGTVELTMPEPVSLSGRIYDADGELMEKAKVYLYPSDAYNASYGVKKIVLEADDNGYYEFTDIPQGNYIVRVKPNRKKYKSLMSTYYGDVLLRCSATEITVGISDVDGIDINAIEVVRGWVDGFVWQDDFSNNGKGNGKGSRSASRKVLEGVKVSLLDKFNSVAYDEQYTDDNGYFSFESVPKGEYQIVAEYEGQKVEIMSSETINVQSYGDSISTEIVIEENAIEVNNTLETGIDMIEAYPNPTSGLLNVSFTYAGEGSQVSMTVYNALGALVKKVTVDVNQGGNQSRINLDELPKGVYMLSINDLDGSNLLEQMLKVIKTAQ